jgi:hypothetical protein
MKTWLIFFLLMIPSMYAYSIDIALNSNNIVNEHFSIPKPDGYDSFEFSFSEKPISINYNGEYSIEEEKIIFFDNGKDMIEFDLIYDNLVEQSGTRRIFRESFEGANNILIRLPEKFILSSKPSTIPEYDSITTDGQNIVLEWENTPSVAVFYEGGLNYVPYAISFAAAIAAIAALFLIHLKKQRAKVVDEMISEDEKLVLAQLKAGVTKQKEISKNLSFSKSKMSKIIRKLEEKNLVEKKPHFKTNILKLK